MKIIDRYIIRGFVPPFITTFLIAMFVLNMQFLWKYIDDIVGKGLEVSVIFELLFYQSLAVIPLAMLLGVLIAAVMVFGNLSERYELVTMKSSGISLSRAMRPLILIVGLLCCFSFLFSDRVIPVASLKFKSRLYDIRKQKPTMSLDPGQFNYDFQNYVIYIGEKDASTQHLGNIRFYDHTKHRGNVNQTNAVEGDMFLTPDKRYMVMQLGAGVRYEDVDAGSNKRAKKYPFSRMSFSSFTTLFDMKQFDMKQTDEDLFKNHYSLLSTRQLVKAMDSIQRYAGTRLEQMPLSMDPSYTYTKRSTMGVRPEKRDSARIFSPKELATTLPDSVSKASSFASIFPIATQKKLYASAYTTASNMQHVAENVCLEMDTYRQSFILFENEIHRKLSLAAALMIFLFIGAPMGAIIRKGGFGWPILIAIIFFTVFFVLSIMGEKMAKNELLPSAVGMWLPCIVLLPIGVILTRKAANEAQLFNKERYYIIWEAIRKKFQRQ